MEKQPKVTKQVNVSQVEIERRHKAVRAAMKEKKLDFLILIVPGNIRWLSNNPLGTLREVLLMPQDGLMRMSSLSGPMVPPLLTSPPPPVGFDPPLSAPFMPALEYTTHYVGELLVKALNKYKDARIGIAGMKFMNLGSYEYLIKHLPSLKIENATDLVDYIKAPKSAEELALIRETCRLDDVLFQYALTIIRPGRMPFEIQADLIRKWTDLAAEEYAGYVTVAKVNGPQLRDKFRPIEKDDYITVLLEPRGPGGIWAEVARSICFGKVPVELEEHFGYAVEAREVFLKNFKVGVEPQLLWDLNNDYMVKHGCEKESRLFAHSQGYDMVERPCITPGETMPMPKRLHMAIHPTAYSQKARAFVCDNYFLHEDGKVEMLHKTPVKVFAV